MQVVRWGDQTVIMGTDQSKIGSCMWQQSVVATVIVGQDQRVIEAGRQ